MQCIITEKQSNQHAMKDQRKGLFTHTVSANANPKLSHGGPSKRQASGWQNPSNLRLRSKLTKTRIIHKASTIGLDKQTFSA